jgi:hypothetical protein
MKTVYILLLAFSCFTLFTCEKESNSDQLGNLADGQRVEKLSKRDYVIYITAADPQTGKLKLSDNGFTGISNATDVDYDHIYWVVGDKVDNISTITGFKHLGGKFIFDTKPSPIAADKQKKSVWRAIYKVGSFEVGDYVEYCISWRDAAGNEHNHDPKISVNP